MRINPINIKIFEIIQVEYTFLLIPDKIIRCNKEIAKTS